VKTFVRISEEGLNGFLFEIGNWRGFRSENDDKDQESQSLSQDRRTHNYYYYHINKKTNKNSDKRITITQQDIIDEPRFKPRAKNWFQEVGRVIGSTLGGSIGFSEPGGLLGEQAATAIQEGANIVKTSVSTTIKKVGNLLHKAWNGLKSIF
jgi:hypothetical protein